MSDAALVSQPRSTPVRARHAASLIVLRRDASVGMLMGLRGAGHRFMPNRLVFPGGAVDRADGVASVTSPLLPHVQTALQKAAQPRLAQAIAVAAARELVEETGLSLGAPPCLAGLDYLGRLVTPPISPVRFNARFFVVDAAAVTGELAGSGELEGLRWYGLEEALALDLAHPTRVVIGWLQQWLAMSPAERTERTKTAVVRNRILGWE